MSQRIVSQLPASTPSNPYFASPQRTAADCKDRENRSTHVPGTRERIALVNVPADGVCLIAKDKTLRWSNLAEVFDRIHAHERACRTILFARIRLAARARRIEWSRLHKDYT